jgi:predicted CXXCH cytochrome family protein
MRPFRSLSVLVSLLLCCVSPAMAQRHDFTGQCSFCHLSDPAGGVMLFTGDLDALCRTCHDLPGKNSHPSGIVPGMAMPGGFWLDGAGRLNCATCHDPHPEEGEDAPFLLRGSAGDTDFCRLCHAEGVDQEGKHTAAVFVAHGRSPTPSAASSGLDQISTDCLACHGGSGGPHVDYCLLLDKMEQSCTGHLVGVDYAELAARNRGLRSPASLSGNITLYEGKVGCPSCHSIYSREAQLLVMSNTGSALCMECHLK